MFQAIRSDKASPLAAIAESLPLDLDALALREGDPVECARLRVARLEVAVRQSSDETALLARTLRAADAFEAAAAPCRREVTTWVIDTWRVRRRVTFARRERRRPRRR